MYCKYCGGEVLETSKYCQHCGSALLDSPLIETTYTPEYYDANIYGWKYGYEYAPYQLPPRRVTTYFWPNIFLLFAFSPILGFIGVVISQQASIALRLGYLERAVTRARLAEIVFWIGLAVGIFSYLGVAVERWDELFDIAIASYPGTR